MLSYDQVKDKPTILLAFTGQTLDEFEELLVAFTRAWQQITRELHMPRGGTTSDENEVLYSNYHHT